MEVILNVVAAILLVLPIFDWTAVYILRKTRLAVETDGKPHIALRERSLMAKILATAVSLNASLAVIRIWHPDIPSWLPIAILSISLILVSIPNLYWLSLYIRNRFRSR